MPDNLDKAASEVIPAMNQRTGLQTLLQVPIINEMYGRIGGADFYRSAISVLKGFIEVAQGRGLTPIAEEHTARLAFAQSALERELARTPIPTSPLDAEPRMRHTADGSFIVVGGGPDNGGYAIKLNEQGENSMVLR